MNIEPKSPTIVTPLDIESAVATQFDVVVIGGGHAGVESAAAAARMGASTALITLKVSGIGQMSCNPAIGGLGKGHLVKEVDALGGIMGKAIDQGGIQFRMLNTSKGPAVRASRAQADRKLYREAVQSAVVAQEGLSVVEGEAAGLVVEDSRIVGVKLGSGSVIRGRSVVVTTGTFLRGLMHTGETQTAGGRVGDKSSNNLSDSLRSLGFKLGRLKTGTPPRLRLSSIDFTGLSEQPGDEAPKPFSMMTESIDRGQISCWVTTTTEETHEIIRSQKHRSPMFNGQISSGGPRYCPSIEDKVFRFSDKKSHNVFLEPEGYDSDIVYPNGISTSLPLDVQEEFVRTLPGLENVEILKAGYAVEYDVIDARVLKPTLESKDIENLFFAGQINGTSGYEEAAAQGLLAGVNAVLKYQEKDPFIVSRSEGYLGVMVDDLCSNGVDEPYRMFTSRAEYRLILREDNAPLRMCPRAKELGLLSPDQEQFFDRWLSDYERLRKEVSETRLKPSEEVNSWLENAGSAILKDAISIEQLVKRPELTLAGILDQFPVSFEPLSAVIEPLQVEIKFSGYLRRQEDEIARLKKVEKVTIPADFPFESISNMRIEHREKLSQYRPHSMAAAMKIPGMTPTSLSLLSVHVKKFGAGKSSQS